MGSRRKSLSASRVVEEVVIGFYAALLLLTVAHQHPNRTIDLLPKRRSLRWILNTIIPDWRFFAPRPATSDYHVHYRVDLGGGRGSQWVPMVMLQRRTPSQVVLFPRRRESKAVFDLVNELLTATAAGQQEVERTTGYRLLAQRALFHAWRNPHAVGAQFCIVKDDGYATESRIDALYASPYLTFDDDVHHPMRREHKERT